MSYFFKQRSLFFPFLFFPLFPFLRGTLLRQRIAFWPIRDSGAAGVLADLSFLTPGTGTGNFRCSMLLRAAGAWLWLAVVAARLGD